ncbi:MAG: restriction endonuclease subunit S [Bacteroidales bacterium]
MSEWKEEILGSVLDVKYGKDHKKLQDGNIPCYGSGGLMRYVDEKLYDKPSILIPRKGSLNNIMFQNRPFWTVDTMFWTIINEEKVFPKFLFYQLTLIDYTALNVGSAVPSLTVHVINEIEINLPPLPEQKAIAEVLSSLDDKIDLLHRQNKTLEQMAETLFRQWFVEEAKDDWEEGTLGEVIEIYDNLRIPLSKMERDKKKDGKLYPYYGAAQIMDYINDYIFDGEYILLGEDGTVRTDEGYPVLQYATGKFWVNNHTHVIKAKHPYNNFFVWNYLRKKNIDEIVTGAVQPKINQANLKSIDFPKFPENLISDFNFITEPLFQKINQNKIQISTLEKLRDTLLPKLMSGEVRLNTI